MKPLVAAFKSVVTANAALRQAGAVLHPDLLKSMSPGNSDPSDLRAAVAKAKAIVDTHVYDEKDVKRKCEALGCMLVVGKPDMLLLDIDTPEAQETYNKNSWLLTRDGIRIMRKSTWQSSNGHHHIVLYLHAAIADPVERFLLQASLGSDGARELANLQDYKKTGLDSCNVLFRPIDTTADACPVKL